MGRLGLWLSADPAAVLAALLLIGFRRTFEAAVAAFLLVTAWLPDRLAIFLLLNHAVEMSLKQALWRDIHGDT